MGFNKINNGMIVDALNVASVYVSGQTGRHADCNITHPYWE